MSVDYRRPAWNSLTTVHRHLSEGGELARRYRTDVNLFASARDDSAEALAALGALFGPGETGFILQIPEIRLPPELEAVKTAQGVQMRLADTPEAPDAADMVALTEADAPEMLALATLTEPGPFLDRTHEMATFWGIRIDGRLAAMAGERMRFPGASEISGVCTHPDYRGQGLARRLSAHVTQRVLARGDRPFLHAWADNHGAIRLYEGLGYRIECPVNVAVVTRRTP
jgi:ribosomal protein S18 acetylase RimI-like enzyme